MKTLFTCLLALCAAEAVALGPVLLVKPVIIGTPAKWLPVEDLVADAGVATLAMVTAPPVIAATETRPYVFVRGVWPVAKQQALSNAAADSNGEEPLLVDCEMERQMRATSSPPNDGESSWKKFDLQGAVDVYNRLKAYAPDVVDPAARSAVITSPLPVRTDGAWQDVSHSRLKTAPAGSLLLFRCPDFDVRQGVEYRYRVKLKLKTGKSTVWTEWSEPTDWVAVPSE